MLRIGALLPGRAASLLVATFVLTSGCITADGTVGPDGRASVTLSYPTRATSGNDRFARMAVTASGVTIESLTIGDAKPGAQLPRRATAKLTTSDVTTLSKLPLLRAFGVTITRDPKPDGGGTLTVTVKNGAPKQPDDPTVVEMMKRQVRVAVALPGPVVETSARKKNSVVKWKFPAGDFSMGKPLELTATYAPPAAGKTKAAGATS
jgi:hypothetical protein